MHATLPNAHSCCLEARFAQAPLGNYPQALRASFAQRGTQAPKPFWATDARGSPYHWATTPGRFAPYHWALLAARLTLRTPLGQLTRVRAQCLLCLKSTPKNHDSATMIGHVIICSPPA